MSNAYVYKMRQKEKLDLLFNFFPKFFLFLFCISSPTNINCRRNGEVTGPDGNLFNSYSVPFLAAGLLSFRLSLSLVVLTLLMAQRAELSVIIQGSSSLFFFFPLSLYPKLFSLFCVCSRLGLASSGPACNNGAQVLRVLAAADQCQQQRSPSCR